MTRNEYNFFVMADKPSGVGSREGEALLLTRPGLLWPWGPPHHSPRAQLEKEVSQLWGRVDSDFPPPAESLWSLN